MEGLNPFDTLVLVAFAIAGMKIFTGPIGAALGDRLRGRREHAANPALAADVELLQTRLAEVEERLDFAERLLASRERADQLLGGRVNDHP
ncbi:MAG: hypothetical protein H0T44_14935 [Gemmatimonadales bacterium]|nr:hypothetical protein [Gemmatimonadales bacterium]